MPGFRIERGPFDPAALAALPDPGRRLRDWPVVYTLSSDRAVYVGETTSAVSRMHQHSLSGKKSDLTQLRIVVDGEFNKSVCLDLEAHLIRWFGGDATYEVRNANAGIASANYFSRDGYRARFAEVFEALKADGLFRSTIREIENSEFFKFSPFKELNEIQAAVVVDILEGLTEDLAADPRRERTSTTVVQGDPGTGKTVVAIYLMKLIQDIARADATVADQETEESVFAEFFLPDVVELFREFRVGLVIPQQALRATLKNVFRKTAGLRPDMVLTPFDVGNGDELWDLLIVDETHRLTQRAVQGHPSLTKLYPEITARIFGGPDDSKTQVDWIQARSRHQIFLLDGAQSVRPSDVPRAALRELTARAERDHRTYRLSQQMRVRADTDYVRYVRGMFDGGPPDPAALGRYDLRLFDHVGALRDEIRARDQETGLARMAAGFAWAWISKGIPGDSAPYDIQVDGEQMRWNRTDRDWIMSPSAIDEVGSIHTLQGYDLNYAGVIIGLDLRVDPRTGRLMFDRDSYFDRKGKSNNNLLGITYSDADLLEYVLNAYRVLLTRGILGTYVYACDPALREQLRPYFPGH
jgi:DUF2075 family protein